MNGVNWCLFTLWLSSWSEPFTEKIMVSLEQEAGFQVATRAWMCFQMPCSLPSACSSVFVSVPHCLNYFFVVIFDSWVLQLCYSMRFFLFLALCTYNLLISTKILLGFWLHWLLGNWYFHNILFCSMNMVYLFIYLGILPLTSVMFVVASDYVENIHIFHV